MEKENSKKDLIIPYAVIPTVFAIATFAFGVYSRLERRLALMESKLELHETQLQNRKDSINNIYSILEKNGANDIEVAKALFELKGRIER
jgi:hypothetical protein